MKFAKGHISVKNVGGVMVLILSTLFDNVFIFVPSFVKVSHRVSELRA